MRWIVELRETPMEELATMAGSVSLVLIASWVLFTAMEMLG